MFFGLLYRPEIKREKQKRRQSAALPTPLSQAYQKSRIRCCQTTQVDYRHRKRRKNHYSQPRYSGTYLWIMVKVGKEQLFTLGTKNLLKVIKLPRPKSGGGGGGGGKASNSGEGDG